MNSINIRQEQEHDRLVVEFLVQQAFKNEIFSDQNEHILVNKLRSSEAFVPELSLVAEMPDGQVIGYISLTEILVKESFSGQNDIFKPKESVVYHKGCLTLAPVAVLPEFQQRGVGAELIKKAHNIAYKLGYKGVVVLGHKDYYPKFGYRQASLYQINLPFEVPKENAMCKELQKYGLDGIRGEVIYPKEFGLNPDEINL